jgi:ABC-type antimicrobial peptide transport system permease subunit
MMLAGGFALVALMLAAIGIYGVVNYSVSRRTKEIGIRVALGATRGDLSRLVFRETLTTAGLGVVIGLAAAIALSRFLRTLLYDVRAADPVTYVIVSAVLLGVALVAAWLPARRASRVDPLSALRFD